MGPLMGSVDRADMERIDEEAKARGPRKFRKRPVAIEAVQYHGGNFEECALFVGAATRGAPGDYTLSIQTLEGLMEAHPGDWIIKGVKGEFYPCKPDIFAATYEPVGHAPVLGDCFPPSLPAAMPAYPQREGEPFTGSPLIKP